MSPLVRDYICYLQCMYSTNIMILLVEMIPIIESIHLIPIFNLLGFRKIIRKNG